MGNSHVLELLVGWDLERRYVASLIAVCVSNVT